MINLVCIKIFIKNIYLRNSIQVILLAMVGLFTNKNFYKNIYLRNTNYMI